MPAVAIQAQAGSPGVPASTNEYSIGFNTTSGQVVLRDSTGAANYTVTTDASIGDQTSVTANRTQRIAVKALVGATVHAGTGGVVAWTVPEAVAIIVDRVIIDITTVATAACTLDIGYTATSATTTSDTMLDGIDANAAVAVFDSMDASLDSGANAHAQKAAVGKWITIDEKTGDATGMVANLYIFYHIV